MSERKDIEPFSHQVYSTLGTFWTESFGQPQVARGFCKLLTDFSSLTPQLNGFVLDLTSGGRVRESGGFTVSIDHKTIKRKDHHDKGKPDKPQGPGNEEPEYDPEAFVMTIDTEQFGSAPDTFVLTAGNTGTYDATVDWGDGNTDTVTAYNDPALYHVYSSPGTYVVQITGKFSEFAFSADSRKLIKINQWGNLSMESLRYSFYNCENLLLLPEGSITGAESVTTCESCFASCASLKRIPSGLFDRMPLIEDFSSCFDNCTLVTTIPAGLFYKNTQARYFLSTFGNCSIYSIPYGLFFYNTLAYEFSWCFESNNISGIPADLFDRNTDAVFLDGCFAYNALLTSIPASLFSSNGSVEEFRYCFYSTGIDAIPDGLFDNNPHVFTFNLCFGRCANLTTIPATLFQASRTRITNMEAVFIDCSSLVSIPQGLFDGLNPFYFRNCFQGCTSLTTIPSGLFSGATNNLSFANVFKDCTSLVSVPFDVFANNAGVLTFNYAFIGCSSLSSVGAGIFDDCVAATSFTSCFSGCVSLTGPSALSSDIFANNTAANLFPGCFAGVTLEATLYSEMLISLDTHNPNNSVTFDGGNSMYFQSAVAARGNLVSRSWSITDGGLLAFDFEYFRPGGTYGYLRPDELSVYRRPEPVFEYLGPEGQGYFAPDGESIYTMPVGDRFLFLRPDNVSTYFRPDEAGQYIRN